MKKIDVVLNIHAIEVDQFQKYYKSCIGDYIGFFHNANNYRKSSARITDIILNVREPKWSTYKMELTFIIEKTDVDDENNIFDNIGLLDTITTFDYNHICLRLEDNILMYGEDLPTFNTYRPIRLSGPITC